jgi:hypothetical protein
VHPAPQPGPRAIVADGHVARLAPWVDAADEVRERELVEAVASDPLLQAKDLLDAAIDQRLKQGLPELAADRARRTAAYALKVQDEYDRERARREARRRLEAEERGQLQLPEILTLRERLARPRLAH